MIPRILDFIETYGNTHLICDSRLPLLSQGSLEEEALLYCLNDTALLQVIDTFTSLTEKRLHTDSSTTALSGGQQVILMLCLALHSPAPRILLVDIYSSLDAQRRNAVHSLIQRFTYLKQDIKLISI